jgi:acyl-coenzyme A synthetase/AMP-(fatty) acid ligase/acyl carrier protein
LTTLRGVTLSGEPLYKSDIDLCRRLLPRDCALINSLGATEAPMSARYPIDQSELKGNLVPVGFPTAGVTISLRGENGEPVGADEPGEIVIQSRYLAIGYWRNDELTATKFLRASDFPDERTYLTGDLGRFLPDGALIHLGRKDDIVKIRGYRIGVAEIEATLLEHSCVSEAAVVARDEPDGDSYLAAYIVPSVDIAPTVTELIAFLAVRLPDFMIPAQFICMTAFPMINNKVDRKALPRLARFQRDVNQPYIPPRDAGERAIAEIWQEVLGIGPIGIHDEFLSMGGDSLHAAKIIARMNQALECNVPIGSFFEAKTIARLAERLRNRSTPDIAEPNGSK